MTTTDDTCICCPLLSIKINKCQPLAKGGQNQIHLGFRFSKVRGEWDASHWSHRVAEPMTSSHLFCHRHVGQYDVLLHGCVAYKSHIARAARHALKSSGKSTIWIVASAVDLQSVANALVAHGRRIVTCALYRYAIPVSPS